MKNKYILLIKFALYVLSFLIIIKFSIPQTLEINAGRESLVLEYMGKSTVVFWQIVSYLFIALVLHIVPFFILARSSSVVSKLFNLSSLLNICYFFVGLLFFWTSILSINFIFFPRSQFSFYLLEDLTHKHVDNLAKYSLFTLLLIIVIPYIYKIFKHKRILKKIPAPAYTYAIVFLLLTGVSVLFVNRSEASSNRIKSTKPNVIFIGMDSVAPIHLQHNPKILKYLKKQLNTGLHFSNSLTPLARTFPSWTSILSGKMPVHSGARFNLTTLNKINKEPNLLPKILKKQGYQTIYAQDERKFNNLNESFGFDKVIGPRIGASEFILTHLSDLPMVNVAMLLPGSEYIFPSNTLNRADSIHYSPQKFIHKLLDSIPNDTDKPLFLATHLCLSHFPYTWKDYKGTTTGNSFEYAQQQSLVVLEKQLKQLINGLKERGFLDNAILVLLSDHGESLNYDDGMWFNPEKGDKNYLKDETLPRPVALSGNYSGHGTKVLAKSQYTTLLSFKGFGSFSKIFNKSKVQLQQQVSLIDIMPTVLSALKYPLPENIDGKNLLEENLNDRFLFSETGLTFSSLVSVKNINKEKLLQEAKDYYTVEENTGLLILKPDLYPSLVKFKNYAVHYNDWVLAFYRKKEKKPIAVLVHKLTGRWTVGENKELIEEAPIRLMSAKFRYLYGDEVSDLIQTWPFNDLSLSASSNYHSSRIFLHHPE